MPVRLMREFIKTEASGGIILFAAAVLAVFLDNSPWHQYYHTLFNLPVVIKVGMLELSKPLLLWINDGFMAVFFLLVGLEIKREMLEGELNSFAKAVLPGIVALGGMVVPGLIYAYLNWGDSVALRGWAIPTATDIAFSLGILSLLRSRIPLTLKIFLTALAIFDDIGAIAVIAIFYTEHISIILLVVALGLIAILFLLNYFKVMRLAPYFLVGIVLWICVLKSGVHATLAGIVLALAIPLRHSKDPKRSPLRELESMLHPWVAYGILPLFAFANAGVSFAGVGMKELLSPITLGIAGGLFIGKQIGIWGGTMLSVKLGIAKMPQGATSLGIYGVSLLAGVGFTMSLFIGTLAFSHSGNYPILVKTGVILGSLLSGVLGYLVLYFSHKPALENV